MKLHITIVLSAVIIAAGLVLASRQANERRLFADDMLPAKTIARADVIKAVQALDQSRLLSFVTDPKQGVTAFQVTDAKAALDGKSIGIFGQAVLPDGKRAPLNFSFERDEFGRWVMKGDRGWMVLPL